MLYASDEERAEFNSGNQKYLILTFSDGTVITNDDIYTGSMKFEQSICDEEQLIYGSCSSASFSVKVFGTTKRYKSLTVYPVFKAGNYERPLGKFKVYSDTATSDKLYRQLECYDDLYEILQTNYADWYNNLNFPMTLKQYRDAFFNKVGVTQRSVMLINDDIEITKNMVTNEYSGLDIIKNICEINACFGHLDYDNNFRYVIMTTADDSLYPANDLYPDTDLYPKDWISERISDTAYVVLIDDSLYPKIKDLYPSDNLYPKFRRKEMILGNSFLQGSLRYEEYSTSVITQLQIRQTEYDVGAVVGEEGNTYIIEDNPLLYGKSTEELAEIGLRFLAIVPIAYVPSSVKVRAMPWHELGDIINIVSKNHVITMPILTRKITGITAALDEYSAKGTENYLQNANSVNKSIKVLNQRTNELIRTVDETISTLTRYMETTDGTLKQHQTQITQNAEAITLEANRAIKREGELVEDYTARIQVTADAISSEVTRATKVEGLLSTRITQNADSITSEVSRAKGAEVSLSSRIVQTINSISLSVDNGASTAGITISLNDGAGTSKTSNKGTINMTGLVTFSNAQSSFNNYVTTIDGGKISTGSVDTNRLKVGADGYAEFDSPVRFNDVVRFAHTGTSLEIRDEVRVWDGSKYNGGESGEWDIDGTKYTFGHGILIHRG